MFAKLKIKNRAVCSWAAYTSRIFVDVCVDVNVCGAAMYIGQKVILYDYDSPHLDSDI